LYATVLLNSLTCGMDSHGPRNRHIRWGIFWRHLVNTVEQSGLSSDVGCLYHYCHSLLTLVLFIFEKFFLFQFDHTYFSIKLMFLLTYVLML